MAPEDRGDKKFLNLSIHRGPGQGGGKEDGFEIYGVRVQRCGVIYKEPDLVSERPCIDISPDNKGGWVPDPWRRQP